jgi:hypothetical protein
MRGSTPPQAGRLNGLGKSDADWGQPRSAVLLKTGKFSQESHAFDEYNIVKVADVERLTQTD